MEYPTQLNDVSACTKFIKWRKEQEEYLKFVKATVFEMMTPFSVCIMQPWYPTVIIINKHLLKMLFFACIGKGQNTIFKWLKEFNHY